MTSRTVARTALLTAFLTAFLAALALPAAAPAKTITVQTTIQAAVDAASPGDTIVVPPGTYHEGVVVEKSGLTIRGSTAAVLDASGHDYGIQVETGAAGDPPRFAGCPDLAIHDFTLMGLTVRDADETGVFLRGVDGFRLTGTRYVDNGEYGAFPRCAVDGRIDHNSGGGGEDATVYVGVDDGVVVENNRLFRAEIGIELEDTTNTIVRNNLVFDNVAGIFVIVLPGLPRTSSDHALIENNVVKDNNLPNPFSPPPPFFDDLQLLPTGTGILNVGGDQIVIRRNTVTGNDTVGIGMADNPFGFGPPDDGRVVQNTVKGNGLDPDLRDGPGHGDLLYDGTGTNNCFARNVYDTDFPAGIAEAFACS